MVVREESVGDWGASLLNALKGIEDPRKPKGVRHPLPAVLALAMCAMLGGARSLYAIAQWGREHPQFAQSLGFSRERILCVATLHHVFRRLDADAFESALDRWAQECLGDGESTIAIDGKALWGIHGRGDRKESELGLASELLAGMDLTGRVVTGDALYAQRRLSQRVLEQGGDYFWVLKDNQPWVKDAVSLLFEQPLWGESFGEAFQEGCCGDRWERRRLWASTALNGYLDWPGVGQVCCVERTRRHKSRESVERAYAVTSLPVERAGAARLLEIWRGHWGIGNRLHWVRDVVFGEDQSQVRTGSAPQLLAALPNLVIGTLRLSITTSVPQFRQLCGENNFT